jgi:hypothetical protein
MEFLIFSLLNFGIIETGYAGFLIPRICYISVSSVTELYYNHFIKSSKSRNFNTMDGTVENGSQEARVDVMEQEKPLLSNHGHLLMSGPLGICDDPYCTICPSYFTSSSVSVSLTPSVRNFTFKLFQSWRDTFSHHQTMFAEMFKLHMAFSLIIRLIILHE